MADLILLPYRASDANFELVTDAKAFFYGDGTSTPLTVYTDSGLGTPRGTSLLSGQNGVGPGCFEECWVPSGTGVKVNIQDGGDIADGAGTSLPGFPRDNFPTIAETDLAASSTTFTPITGNGATDVQTAIANNTNRINDVENTTRISTSTGSSGSYAITAANTITAYSAGLEYEFIANHASVGSGSDSLNVDTVGAVTLKKYEGSTTKGDLAAGDIAAGDKVRVKHDGTHFVVVSPLNAGEETRGIVEAATLAETRAGTAGKFPDAEKVKAAALSFIDGDLLVADGTTVTVTGLSGYSYIEFECIGNAASTSTLLTLQARVSDGTWRSLISTAAGSGADAGFMFSGYIRNFNNADSSDEHSGVVFFHRTSGGALDRSAAENSFDDSTRFHGGFLSVRDEVWDELRILGSENFEGNDADEATELKVWGR